MNLDIAIIALLKKHEGRVSRGKMWQDFDNYSKGYLYERLLALKRSKLIEEVGGWYVLTKRGWKIAVDENY